MAMAARRMAKATPPGSRRPAMELRREAPEDLSWQAAIGLFVEGWAADHPGIRPTTLEHYREQGNDAAAEAMRARFFARRWDLSSYFKALKQRFTQWYNRKHERKGYLWGERF